MLGGLDGLMPQGLTDNLDGLVLIFQRHGKAVTGSIYCNVLLTLREFQLLGNLTERDIENYYLVCGATLGAMIYERCLMRICIRHLS